MLATWFLNIIGIVIIFIMFGAPVYYIVQWRLRRKTTFDDRKIHRFSLISALVLTPPLYVAMVFVIYYVFTYLLSAA